MGSDVYVLIEEGNGWDGVSDSLVEVCATLATAQRIYLDCAFPLKGPRGGKRPPRPEVSWTTDEGDLWAPLIHASVLTRMQAGEYRIERRPLR